jgi:hypothetical protein
MLLDAVKFGIEDVSVERYGLSEIVAASDLPDD